VRWPLLVVQSHLFPIGICAAAIERGLLSEDIPTPERRSQLRLFEDMRAEGGIGGRGAGSWAPVAKRLRAVLWEKEEPPLLGIVKQMFWRARKRVELLLQGRETCGDERRRAKRFAKEVGMMRKSRGVFMEVGASCTRVPPSPH